MRLYCIYDKIAKEGSTPFEAKNDDVAWRNYQHVLEKNALRDNEYSLLYIGVFEKDPVKLTPSDVPIEVFANRMEE